MEYKANKVTGDAGEYFFAFKITRDFDWVVRLLDVDIGVDAEIEIITDEVSTAHMIKAQIKTSRSVKGKRHSIYVDEEHIEYWRKINLPVIVCLVDLEGEKIFWKLITSEDDYSSRGESKKVTFDLLQDELTIDNKTDIEHIAIPNEVVELQKLRLEYRKQRALLLSTDSQVVLSQQFDAIEKARELVSQMNRLVTIHPFIASNELMASIAKAPIWLNARENNLLRHERADEGFE